MRKYYYSLLSIGLSIVSIIYLIILNYRLAQNYLQADGKTRALFGIQELSWLAYKIYLSPLLLGSAILWILAARKHEQKAFIITVVVVNATAIIMVFVRIWIWMI